MGSGRSVLTFTANWARKPVSRAHVRFTVLVFSMPCSHSRAVEGRASKISPTPWPHKRRSFFFFELDVLGQQLVGDFVGQRRFSNHRLRPPFFVTSLKFQCFSPVALTGSTFWGSSAMAVGPTKRRNCVRKIPRPLEFERGCGKVNIRLLYCRPCHGPAMARPWSGHGPAMARLLPGHGTAVARPLPGHRPAMARPSSGHGPAMAPPWPGHGPAIVRPWPGHRPAIVL